MAKEIVPVYITTTDPTTASDTVHGFRAGQLWVNTTTPSLFFCSSAATAAAVWTNATGTSMTSEQVMDIVGAMLGDTATVDVTYDDAGDVTSFAIVAGSITDTHIAAANKDGLAATPSMRTLGTGGTQACAGNDSRLSDARTPTAHQSTHVPGDTDALPWTTIHGRGNTASKPTAAASNTGYIYFDTDLGKLQRSNGTSWDDISEAGGGGGSADPTDAALNWGLQFWSI